MALPSVGNTLVAPQHKRRDSLTGFAGMKLNTLLNTNGATVGVVEPNMQYEAPLPVTMNHDISNPTTGHYSQQTLYVPNGGRIKSETGSERGASPHTSDHSSRYSSQTPQNNTVNYQQQLAVQLQNSMRYPSPSQLPQQNGLSLLSHPFHPNGTTDSPYQQQTSQPAQLGAVQQAVQQVDGTSADGARTSTGSSGLPKAFACSTCQKGFARRSDLARHERIHSGVRPHVCDHPGCGKQFIQRSALTVHSRVHTGEKPHMCERCGKPFSDSSSLARHRRIHSGKRPYKCPYADCQKTFTRRTTLTRHQNHHTGTIEESEAATAAALATRVNMATQRSSRSDEENEYSGDGKSPMTQPPERTSASPASGMNGVAGLSRQQSDYYMNAMSGGMNGGMAAVPAHIRGEIQSTSRAASPAQYSMPVNGSPVARPQLTSNPSSTYNPPQILEPPTSNGQQQPASGNNSPHISGGLAGWQSPHTGMTAAPQNGYSYADTTPGGYSTVSSIQDYYSQATAPRASAGPMDYNPMRGQEMWSQHQQ